MGGVGWVGRWVGGGVGVNPDVKATFRVGHQEAEELPWVPVVRSHTGTLKSLQAALHVLPQDSAFVMSENPGHSL